MKSNRCQEITVEVLPALQTKSTLKQLQATDFETVLKRETKDGGIFPSLAQKPTTRKKKKVTINDKPTINVLPVIKSNKEDNGHVTQDFRQSLNQQTTDKNRHDYSMQCELAFGRISQNISRIKYSYFKRIASPPPLRKKEKLYKAFQESLKKQDETKSGLILRTEEEYEKMKAERENLQLQFVKRHKIKKRISS